MQFVAQIRAGHRSNLSCFIERITDLQRLNMVGEFLEELIVDRVDDNESLGCNAGLAAVVITRPRPDLGGLVDIRIVQYDVRSGSAELEHAWLQFGAGCRSNGATCRFRTGESDCRDNRMPNDIRNLTR